jgi:peptide deformylase
MKLPEIKILDEKDQRLRLISKEVSFPLTKKELNLIKDVETYLKMSQIDKYLEKYKLRAGMGLAFVQLGIPKQIFIIVNEEED